MLEKTRRMLHGQGIEMEVSDAAIDALLDRGWDPTFGARPLRREIQRSLEAPLAEQLIAGTITEKSRVRVDFRDGTFQFEEVGRAAEERPYEAPPAVH